MISGTGCEGPGQLLTALPSSACQLILGCEWSNSRNLPGGIHMLLLNLSSRSKEGLPHNFQQIPPMSLAPVRSHAYSWTNHWHEDHSWPGQRASFSGTCTLHVRDRGISSIKPSSVWRGLLDRQCPLALQPASRHSLSSDQECGERAGGWSVVWVLGDAWVQSIQHSGVNVPWNHQNYPKKNILGKNLTFTASDLNLLPQM